MPPLNAKKTVGTGSKWVEKTITIKTIIVPQQGMRIEDDTPCKEVEIKALTLGYIAVHKSPGDEWEGFWSVTSTAAGVAYVFVKSEEDAKRIGEILWTQCILAVRERTIAGTRNRLPGHIVEWLRKCREAQAFVEME